MLSFQHNIKLSILKNPLLKSKFLFFVKERNEIVRESSNKKIPMDLILILIATLFVLLGLIGSVLPILPGPITSWIGLLIIHFTEAIPFNWMFLIFTLFVAIFIWFLDYIFPAIGTKHFGGSKYGVIGTSIGFILGVISPVPFGIIIGPFLGAFIGEYLNNTNSRGALKAAFGSFIGFLTSTFLKIIVAFIYFGLFIHKVWEVKDTLF